jgi:hypothetical protein
MVISIVGQTLQYQIIEFMLNTRITKKNMTSATTTTHTQLTKRFIVVSVITLSLALASYFYYSLTHRSVDLFTIPNPTQGLHQQKLIPSADIPKLSQQ